MGAFLFCPTTSALAAAGLSGASRALLHVELEQLYNRHRGALTDYAQGLLGCRGRAEDVVQDAFLKLWEDGDPRAIRDALKYLFRVVRNLAIDRLRRLGLEGRYQVDDERLPDVPAPTPSPERVVLGELHWQRLQHALAELPARTRTAFTMSQVEGYSQREVARHLCASPTQVHFLVRDAVGHCRVRLGDVAA
ncbi:MAG: sigma-70 family RNA polymerase sigma factor [Pseudomonas sp.]|uniref:sigma-70 family RNA polymerase sigma factor n=1 Tax=Pseudomonas sp. TaxID=306 RepID=UPI00299F2E11|nr:sigma-70 family RNA polymerase sigma factor [Pseudomonas sp.]MDX1722644.1 sigma-70 family RNA polymerase sigma factor [Pseudomonas sp.]